MTIKYVIRPGKIQDHNAIQLEFDADALIQLYKVPREACVILINDDPAFEAKYCLYASRGYIFLYPRSDDNYAWLQQSETTHIGLQEFDISI